MGVRVEYKSAVKSGLQKIADTMVAGGTQDEDLIEQTAATQRRVYILDETPRSGVEKDLEKLKNKRVRIAHEKALVAAKIQVIGIVLDDYPGDGELERVKFDLEALIA